MAIQTIRDKQGRPIAFQAQVRARGEKSSSSTCKTYEAAEEFERNAKKVIKANRSVAATRREYDRSTRPVGVVSLASMPVATVADEFAKANPEHCYASYASKVKEFVGAALVCDLDKNWTKEFCERMRKQQAWRRDNCLAEGTIAQYIGMIRRMCNWKAESLGIEKPRLGLTTDYLKPGWDDGRERRLRGDEERRIRDELGLMGAKRLWKKGHKPGARGKPWACARHYQLLFDFAIETCARQCEMVELPWREVDMERRIWALPAVRSKTETSRKIFLTPRALEILEELRADGYSAKGRVFHRLPSTKGVSNSFREAVERAGVEDYVFHDLRHEGISRHKLAKLFEPEVLMKMVGHSSAKMTMRYFNPEDEEILAQMEKAILRRHTPEPDLSLEVDALVARKFQELMASILSGRLDPAVAQAALAQDAVEALTILQPPVAAPLRL